MPGFFDLPSEIRSIIYRLLIPKQTIWSDNFARHDTRDPVQENPQITKSNICLVNRQMFEETYPLLYSQHSFHLSATSANFKFLLDIGQLNREALREIRLDSHVETLFGASRSARGYEELRVTGAAALKKREFANPWYGAYFFNVLAKCSNASINIETSFYFLAFLDASTPLSAFVNMHGYRKATTTAFGIRGYKSLKRPDHKSCHQAAAKEAAKTAILQRLNNGVKRLESPCPEGCKAHKGCTSKDMNATIHLEVECNDCWACAHGDFLDLWSEREGSIFGHQE